VPLTGSKAVKLQLYAWDQTNEDIQCCTDKGS